MKKLLTVLLAAIFLLAVAAPALAETAPIRVGFANINEKGSFGKMVLQNMKKVAA